MANWSEDDLAALGFRKDGTRDPAASGRGGAVGAPVGGEAGRPPPTGANKFGAVRTVAPASWGGERWADSKTGASLSRTMMAQRQAGAILDFFEEVSIPIGVTEKGRIVRYRADAMVILGYVDDPNGGEPAMVIKLYDAKRGDMDTPTSKAKRAALRNRGLNVEVV
jgi:hypothetical protein